MNSKNKKGQAGGGLLAGIGILVAGAAMLYIGIYVNAVVIDATNDSTILTGAHGDTFDSSASRINTAFTLLGIVFIVLGASMVIGTLRSGL